MGENLVITKIVLVVHKSDPQAVINRHFFSPTSRKSLQAACERPREAPLSLDRRSKAGVILPRAKIPFSSFGCGIVLIRSDIQSDGLHHGKETPGDPVFANWDRKPACLP